MEDSEVLPKRRKLDPSEEESSGQKVKDTFSLENEGNERTATSYSIPNIPKKIKWNFKQVRPEVLKCCRSIVDGLDRAGSAGKSRDENKTRPLQQNDLTSREEERKETAFAPKRKLDPDGVKNRVHQGSTSAACVLPTNSHTFLKIPQKLGPSKEIKNGCTINNQAPTQQLPLSRLILDPLTKERLHNEIRKIIKDHTREAMDRAEGLKSRISTLESENRWLKHKVTFLYEALRKELNRRNQNKVPIPTSANSTLQDKLQVTPNESGCLEALLQPQPPSESVIGNKSKDEASHSIERAIAADTNDFLLLGNAVCDKPHQKDKASPAVGHKPKIRPPHNITIPSVEQSITNYKKTKSVSTGSNGPIASIGQDTTLSSVCRPNHVQTLYKAPFQTGFEPPAKSTIHSPVLSRIGTLHHKEINIPSNAKTSNSAPNHVSLLCQVLDEILASSSKGIPDRYTLNPLCRLEAPTLPTNVHKPLTHTVTGIMTSRTTPTGDEVVLCKQHSDQNQKISMKLSTTQSEKTYEGDNEMSLAQQRTAADLSPISLDQEVSKLESKHRELFESSCIVENERKKETPLLANNGSFYYKTRADAQLTSCQLQTNTAAVASSNLKLTKSMPGNPENPVGIPDDINMLAQAARLSSKTTDSILYAEKSSTNQTPPLIRTPDESKKIHTGDLSQQGLNNHALEGYFVSSKSQASQRRFVSQPEEPQRHKCVDRKHISIKGPITRQVDEHQKPLKVKDQNLGKTKQLNPPEHINHRSLQYGDQELTSVSLNKFSTIPCHINSEEGHNSLSPTRFYYSRECQEHTTRQAHNTTLTRTHVISKPRYLPYPPIRPKEQQTPFVSVRSKIQYVPKANEGQSPKPDGLPRQVPPLNGGESRRPHLEEKTSGKKELFDQLPKFFCPPETSLIDVRPTASCSSSANASMRHPSGPYIPRYLPTSDLRTVNSANLPSNSSKTGKQYVDLQPQRHVKSNVKNREESSLCTSDNTKNEGTTSLCNPAFTVGEGSFNSASFQTSTLNPRIELSHLCQRYITQLRSSPRLSDENSMNATAKLLPYTESKSLDLKNSSQQGLKFPSPYSSMKRQTTCQQEGYDAQEMHPQTSFSEHKQDNNNLPHYQLPHPLLYHQKKLPVNDNKNGLSKEWLKSCSSSEKCYLPCLTMSNVKGKES